MVCWSVTLVSPVIKWLNRSRCHLGWGLGWAREPCIRWGSISPHGKGQFWGGERGIPLYSIWRVCAHLCKNGWTDRDAVWFVGLAGPKESCVRWGLHPPWEGAILEEGAPIARYGDTLWSLVWKQQNRSWCCLGCRLGLAQGIMN